MGEQEKWLIQSGKIPPCTAPGQREQLLARPWLMTLGVQREREGGVGARAFGPHRAGGAGGRWP